jgi:hypothetical protein
MTEKRLFRLFTSPSIFNSAKKRVKGKKEKVEEKGKKEQNISTFLKNGEIII